jgi:hypothetical protein
MRQYRGARKACRVDDLFRESRPVLSGQTPSLQLIGSGEATLVGTIYYRLRVSVDWDTTAGKRFSSPLLSR